MPSRIYDNPLQQAHTIAHVGFKLGLCKFGDQDLDTVLLPGFELWFGAQATGQQFQLATYKLVSIILKLGKAPKPDAVYVAPASYCI